MSIKFGDIFGTNEININNPKLEEVLNKTKDVAETVGKKSAEYLDVSRKRIECLDAKTKLSKLYEKFGEMQYNSFIGETVDQAELENTANSIAQLKEKIELYTVEIEEAKAQFNGNVSSAAKKTRSAFQKDFNQADETEVTVDAGEVEVTDAESKE